VRFHGRGHRRGPPRTARAAALGLCAIAILTATGCQRSAHRVRRTIGAQLAGLHLDTGHRYLARGRIDDATAAFESAVERDPACAPAHTHLGLLYAARGDDDRAIQHHRAALQARPDSTRYAVRLADMLVDASHRSIERPERLQAAARVYRHAIELSPGDAALWVKLGRCCVLMQRPRRALDAFAAAARLAGDAPTIHARIREASGSLHPAMAADDRPGTDGVP